MDLITNNIAPADGEQTVRTYCCTYYKSRLLGIESNGYIGITNKRVIYQALSNVGANSSVIQSEVPIADISGISSFKGKYFSLLHLLGALLLASVVSGLLPLLLSTFVMIFDSYTAFQIIAWVVAAGCLVGSFFLEIKSIWRSVLAGASSAAFFALGGGSMISNFSIFTGFRGSDGWQFVLAAIVSIYMLICVFWYSRRPTFSLEINSKGGGNKPIAISSAVGIFGRAATSINAEPAQDSEQLLDEIGAIVLDIQMLGDYGISKWTK